MHMAARVHRWLLWKECETPRGSLMCSHALHVLPLLLTSQLEKYETVPKHLQDQIVAAKAPANA